MSRGYWLIGRFEIAEISPIPILTSVADPGFLPGLRFAPGGAHALLPLARHASSLENASYFLMPLPFRQSHPSPKNLYNPRDQWYDHEIYGSARTAGRGRVHRPVR